AWGRAATLLERAAVGAEWRVEEGEISLVVDRLRFLTRFGTALSLAKSGRFEVRRGRPAAAPPSSLAGAERYGVDLSLLRQSLRLTVAERLDRLDADVEFFRGLRFEAV
ncbi:MAG: hypothetical protein HOP28_03770, partial [Gemmatimonadales bacterium]|nr:hypothetical protein [Gemmatimonadales bacterium]